MKSFTDLIEKVSAEDLPSVYCDMDMVLCNFMKKADQVTGHFVTADKEQRWKDISNTKNFWSELEWMPGAKRIHQMIIKYDAHILSAYSGKDTSSKNGKMKWLYKYTAFL